MSRHSQPEQHLAVRIESEEIYFPIQNFNGHTGTLVLGNSPRQLPRDFKVQAELILVGSNEIIWRGPIKIDLCSETHSFNFKLLIESSNDDWLSWSEVPQILSIFDGGYSHLAKDSVGELLSDLAVYHELVICKLHYMDHERMFSVAARFMDQENLRTLSELVINVKIAQPDLSEKIVLIELELFESVYFIVSTLAENEGDLLIFSLTQHVYAQTNRLSKRTAIHSNAYIQTSIGEICEVSDFGLKIITRISDLKPGATIPIMLSGVEIPFQVVYVRESEHPEKNIMGLYLSDDSPEIRSSWQCLLLKINYPLLARRGSNTQDRQQCWDLLDRSGYFRDDVGKMVFANRESVFNEWVTIDNGGPHAGSTVLGYDNKQAVATIGLSRVTGNVWTAQAAAVVDKPEYLDFTRSIYSWRTRAILQQPDGDYHLAFFAANKPFLDRFFRKFFLKNKDRENAITWTEWLFGFLDRPHKDEDPDYDFKINKFSLNFAHAHKEPFNILIEKKDAHLFTVSTANTIALHGRPHQHLAQFLSSIWCMDGFKPEEINFQLKKYLDCTTPITLFFESQNKEIKNIPELSNLKVSDDKEVVWTCSRHYLPMFLSNSLKSLEQMKRKYRPNNAA